MHELYYKRWRNEERLYSPPAKFLFFYFWEKYSYFVKKFGHFEVGRSYERCIESYWKSGPAFWNPLPPTPHFVTLFMNPKWERFNFIPYLLNSNGNNHQSHWGSTFSLALIHVLVAFNLKTIRFPGPGNLVKHQTHYQNSSTQIKVFIF